MLPLILECWAAAYAALGLTCLGIRTLHRKLIGEASETMILAEVSPHYSDPIQRNSSTSQVEDSSTQSTLSQGSSRRVCFAENSVFTVPNRDDLFQDTSKDTMWYNGENIADFRRSALEEVEFCMDRTGIHEIRRAFRCLYQPAAIYDSIYSDDAIV